MKTWHQAVRDAAVSGSAAAIASATALAACGGAEEGAPMAPMNAVSHWIFGDRAFHQDRPTLRHTVTGYLIHHAAALFWAVQYERWLGQRSKSTPRTLGDAALASGVACFVDYRCTPRPLMPGYEKRLSKKSLFIVYSAFAVGLAAGTVLLGQNRR